VARTVTLNGQAVKIRHPLAPLGLGIITFGIYTLVWYYLINDEMRRQGEDVSPGVSLLAVTLGAPAHNPAVRLDVQHGGAHSSFSRGPRRQ
jgi:hypothetical protein